MNHLTTPAQAFVLAFMLLGWLGCNHLGLDVALMETLAGSDAESSRELGVATDRRPPEFAR